MGHILEVEPRDLVRDQILKIKLKKEAKIILGFWLE